MGWIDRFLVPDTPFRNFSTAHFFMVLLTAALSLLLPLLARRYADERGRLLLARVLSVFVFIWVPMGVALRYGQGLFDPMIDLPINMCPLSATLLPFVVWRPRAAVIEILYFFVLAGTMQAVLTPDILIGFPHYSFIRYWALHGGLVITIIYLATALGYLPSWRSLWKAFGWLQVYTAIVFTVNLTFGTNYFYLMGKPPTPTLLDLLGPWPWYLLAAECLAIGLFCLVYLPVALSRRPLPSFALFGVARRERSGGA